MKRWQILCADAVVPVLFCLPLVALAVRDGLFAELWCDEIGSILKFILVPLTRPLTFYPEPNNHIFYSLLANAYLKLLGLRDYLVLESHPVILRLPSLICTLLTCLATYRLGLLLAGRLAALLGLAVLATSLPLLHFAAQVRGYPLAMLLCVLAVFLAVRLERHGKIRDAFLLCLSTAAALYTLPSNLIFVLPLAGFFLCSGLVRPGPGLPRGRGQACRVAAWTFAGVALGAALYLPVAGQLLANPYARQGGGFSPGGLSEQLPHVLAHFLGGRYFLLPLAAGGLAAILLHPALGQRPRYARGLALMLTLVVAPFVLLCLRGAHPYDRVFLVLLPFFALGLGLVLAALAEVFTPGDLAKGAYVLAVFAACLAALWTRTGEVRQRLAADAAIGAMEQDLSLGYYQHYFRPAALLRQLAGQPGFAGSVYQNGQANLAIQLEGHGIVERGANTGRDVYFSDKGKAFIVTTDPWPIAREVEAAYEGASCRRADAGVSYHKLVACDCPAPCRKRGVDIAANPRIRDLNRLREALMRYRADHGSYPVSQGFNGLFSLWGKSGPGWIPGLVPGYLDDLPRDPRLNADPANQYLYRSDGKDYKLIAHHPEDCPEVRQERSDLIDPARGCRAYGFWSEGAAGW